MVNTHMAIQVDEFISNEVNDLLSRYVINMDIKWHEKFKKDLTTLVRKFYDLDRKY